MDDDVVNLVNLRFMSEYHGVAPEVIMDRRGKGEKFFAMDNEFRKAKEKNGGNEGNRDKGNNKKDNNKSKGKGNGRG